MDDEQKQDMPAPPRFRYKLIKIATLTLLFLVILFFGGFFGLEATSSSKFCSSCHEMKPEYYTWKASTHSEVDCVNCHIQPGAKNLAKSKAEGVAELYKQQTKSYTAPIRMPSEIPDSSCERCHSMKKRNVTSSGDIIIPHDKHMNKGIKCIQCHSGVAHGKITDKKMTFQTDYDKWDSELGASAMADLKFTRPDMDTCMECHKDRKISTDCTTCHTTGMVPKSHKDSEFKQKNHGLRAAKNIQKCNECHKYMSEKSLTGYDEVSTISHFLDQDKQKPKKSQVDYAKENSFCEDCHTKRPASHNSQFFSSHGTLAKKDETKCLACHDYNNTSNPNAVNENRVNCSSCHNNKHNQNPNWRFGHPIQLAENQKPTELCFNCHSKPACTQCHKN